MAYDKVLKLIPEDGGVPIEKVIKGELWKKIKEFALFTVAMGISCAIFYWIGRGYAVLPLPFWVGATAFMMILLVSWGIVK